MTKNQKLIEIWKLVNQIRDIELQVEPLDMKHREDVRWDISFVESYLKGLGQQIEEHDEADKETVSQIQEILPSVKKEFDSYLESLTEDEYLERLEEDQNDAEELCDNWKEVTGKIENILQTN